MPVDPGSGDRKTLRPAVGAVGLAAAGIAAFLILRAFDVDYLRWYLDAGPLVQLVVAGRALAVELERYPRLISARPNEFVAEAWEVVGKTVVALADVVRFSGRQRPPDGLPSPGPLDLLFTVVFGFVYVATALAWSLFVAPLQYAGNLIAGAPVRLALSSPVRTQARKQDGVTYLETKLVFTPSTEGTEVIGLARNPVATTALIASGLLALLGLLVPEA